MRTVRLIKAAQALGFTLKEIHALLAVALAPDGACSELYDLAQAKAEDLAEQHESLQQKRTSLAALLERCPDDGGHSARDCSFLRQLEASSNHVPEPDPDPA